MILSQFMLQWFLWHKLKKISISGFTMVWYLQMTTAVKIIYNKKIYNAYMNCVSLPAFPLSLPTLCIENTLIHPHKYVISLFQN